MELHPYDGRERRFCHTDVSPTAGLVIVARVLHLNELPSQHGVFYDLSFYSGGMGIFDHLAITLPADTNLWKSVTVALRAKTPEEACQDEGWAEDLLWLINDDDEPILPHEATVRFINSKRQAFQSKCVPTSWLYFEEESNINDWTVLWGDDTQLNYLGYSQG